VAAWRTAAGGLRTTADIPRAHHQLLPRERAAALLPRPGVTGRATTVVTAPAGYGKTTLLAEHVRSLRDDGLAAAWVTLSDLPPADASERDPATADAVVEALWDAVTSALVGALTLTRVPAQRPPATGRAVAPGPDRWARLVATLESPGEPIVLVLDDTHAVRDPARLAALSQLASHRTDVVHVVWSGRHEPAVGLSRRRLLGDVVDIGASDLVLRRSEVAQLLEWTDLVAAPAPGELHVVTADDLRISTVDDARVEEVWLRSEGWPAAVRLLAPGGPAADAQLEAYLESEVLGHLGEETVDVLRRTSIATTVPVDLAVRLTGRDDAGALLEEAAREVGLVQHVGHERMAFRLHRELRALLEAQLHDRDATGYRRLHREAAGWAAQAGDDAGAVRHAARADDPALFQRALLRHGVGCILAGGAEDLRHLLEQRAPVTRTPPETALHTLSALALGDATTADALLVHLRSLRGTDQWSSRLQDLFDAAVVRRGRYPDQPFPPELPGALLAMRDPERRDRLSIDVTMHVMVDLAGLDARDGRHEAAAAELERARALAELYGYPELALTCLVQLAGIATTADGIGAARPYAATAVERAVAADRAGSLVLTFAHTVLAWAAFQQLDDVGARRHLDDALATVGSTVDPGVVASVLCCEAFIGYAAGDKHAALHRLHRVVGEFGSATTEPAMLAQVLPRALRIYLAQGEWTWAQQCLDLLDEALPRTGETALAHAMWSRARHRDDLARRLLADAVRGGVRFVTTDARVELLLLRAIVLEEVGDRGGSHDALTQALAAAAPDELVRPFADAAPAVVPLLVAAGGRVGQLEAWRLRVTDMVLAARAGEPADRPGHAGLTPREMAVLADLPSLLPLSAIAAHHHVSLNTLKTQVKAIYRKLGATSRHEAVTVARTSGLLRP
jgi:LuxR family maltose regulon positive regulatory protein